MQSLINYGVYTQNKNSSTSTKTVIVLGMARSGTSMVARLLDGLGIFLGTRKDNAVFEDVEISNALETNNLKLFKQLVEERNSKHKVWGWKRPGSIDQIEAILKETRNPHFIIIYRDLLAIALRNSISMEANIHESLKLANTTYQKINEFVASTNAPLMLVSYEKAIIKKRKFIEGVCDFLDLKFPETNFGQLAGLIEQDRTLYLANSTVKKIKGSVSIIDNKLEIEAEQPGKQNRKAPLKLKLNDKKQPNTEINKTLPLTNFELINGVNKIEVLGKETGLHLKGSPLLYYNKIESTENPINVFLHIPKTAGTSFRVALEKSLRPNKIFPNSSEIKANNGQYPPLEKFNLLNSKRLNNIIWIAGHYQKQIFTPSALPYRYFTFFRDPEERLISNIVHFKTYDPRCTSQNLDEIFEARKSLLVNLQWKFICNSPQQFKNILTFDNDKLRQVAKTLINQLYCFGIKEEFQKSIENFNEKFNSNLAFDKRVNPRKKDFDLSENLRHKIKKAAQKELVLYQTATEIFHQS